MVRFIPHSFLLLLRREMDTHTHTHTHIYIYKRTEWMRVHLWICVKLWTEKNLCAANEKLKIHTILFCFVAQNFPSFLWWFICASVRTAPVLFIRIGSASFTQRICIYYVFNIILHMRSHHHIHYIYLDIDSSYICILGNCIQDKPCQFP